MNMIVNLIFASMLFHASEGSFKIYNGIKFTDPDGRNNNDFGSDVAINNDYTVISSIHDYGNRNVKSGSVSLYANGSLSRLTKLLPNDGKPHQHFGSSVAVNNKFIVIGSKQDNGKTFHEGSVYVYPTNGATWEYEKIVPNDAVKDEHFGYSVDINDENEIVIGAPYMGQNGLISGAIYVFTFNGKKWIQVQKLAPSNGTRYHGIGKSVSITKNFIAVGASGEDYPDPYLVRSGAAYIYRKDSSGVWGEQIQIKSPKPTKYGQFGMSVSIDDTRVVISAPCQDVYKGNAYVYLRVGNTWRLEGELKASNRQGHKNFGFSVSINNRKIVIGTYMDGPVFDKSSHGIAHMFELSNGQWVEKGNFFAKDGGNVYSVKMVRISNGSVIVGCIRYGGTAGIFGAAYVFQV